MGIMYPAKINSPATILSIGIDNVTTTIPLDDLSVLPDAPNICTIGVEEDCETILYTEGQG